MRRTQSALFDAFFGTEFERTASTEELSQMPFKHSLRWDVLKAIVKARKKGLTVPEIMERTEILRREVKLSLVELLDGDFVQEAGTVTDEEGNTWTVWRSTDYGNEQWKNRKR